MGNTNSGFHSSIGLHSSDVTSKMVGHQTQGLQKVAFPASAPIHQSQGMAMSAPSYGHYSKLAQMSKRLGEIVDHYDDCEIRQQMDIARRPQLHQ